ncbi:MucR family transcriptional regulator [Methylobacterium nigriterrae]|uniref:MucR family transcriptional regulator n=1 Tax=Methylobacterium nigriterrae TaxID=3127512 RepID=UPI003013ED71
METEVAASQPHHQDNLFIERAAELVSAYVARNHVAAGELPNLIHTVHASLVGLSQPKPPSSEAVEKPTSAQIKKSIRSDALVSFIDGKAYKTLKRHLTKYGLEPYSYRERYGLPKDYPMVAASYAAQRSELAKNNSLGRPRAAQTSA